jgi:hypothetical protein
MGEHHGNRVRVASGIERLVKPISKREQRGLDGFGLHVIPSSSGTRRPYGESRTPFPPSPNGIRRADDDRAT